MKRLLTVLSVTVLLAALLPAVAQAKHRPNAYCSPTGDFCISARRHDGVRKLKIDTFAHRGRYRLCVWKKSSPDDTRECKRFRLRHKGGGIYGDTVRWRRHFTHHGAGAYLVRWRQSGYPIGPRLGFHAK